MNLYDLTCIAGGVLPQGEAPHLAAAHLQGGAPHQEEDLLLAGKSNEFDLQHGSVHTAAFSGTRAAVTEALGDEAEVAGMDRHQDVDRHQGGARHLGEVLLQDAMDLLVMMVEQIQMW